MKGVLRESWVFDAKEPVSCAPLIVDGHLKERARVILATTLGKIFVLNRQGNIDWVFDSAKTFSEQESMFLNVEEINNINNTPIIIHDKKANIRKIIFGSENSNIYCLDNQGKLVWKVQTKGPIRGSPIVMRKSKKEEIIICGSHDGLIYLINFNGKIIQEIDLGKAIETTPTLIDNKLIVGTKEGEILAVNTKGELLWNFSTKKKLTAKIIATSNEREEKLLLAASQDNNLYALTTDGELLWHFPTKGALLSEVAMIQTDSENKEVVFGSCDNNIYCVSTEGELLWSYETEFWVTATPVIDKQNEQSFVIAGSYDHYVYVLDAQGSYELDYIPGLSGVVNQSTFQSTSMSKEVGDDKGKKLDKYHTDSYIVGCGLISSTNEVLVVTKKGKLYNLQLK
jgi:outer membrane protein assembly factor BamB